jgi:hypothetical protein
VRVLCRPCMQSEFGGEIDEKIQRLEHELAQIEQQWQGKPKSPAALHQLTQLHIELTELQSQRARLTKN